MAVRRCFGGAITESDAFYSLPTNAQTLYLHLCMQADDDGFVNNAASVTKRVPCGRKALEKLEQNRFLLKFGDIYVIKHWLLSNTLKKEKMNPLSYETIAEQVWVKKNRAYTDHRVEGAVTLAQQRRGEGEGEKKKDKLSDKCPPKGREEKKEKIREDNPRKGNSPASAGVWEAVVKAYPKGKLGDVDSAYRAYCQAGLGEGEGKEMMENLKLWNQSQQWRKCGGQYVPQLINWIQKGIWRQKPEGPAVPMGASGQLGQAELEAIQQVLRGG